MDMERQQLVIALRARTPARDPWTRAVLEDLRRRATARNSVWTGVAWLAGVITFAIAFAFPASMTAMACIAGVGGAAIVAHQLRSRVHLARWIRDARLVDAQVVAPDCSHCAALPERVAHVDAFGEKRLVLALPDGARATLPFFAPSSERVPVLHAPDSPIVIALDQEPVAGSTSRARLPRARLHEEATGTRT